MNRKTILLFLAVLCFTLQAKGQISFTDNKLLTDNGTGNGFLVVLPMVIADYNFDGFDDIIFFKGNKVFVRENDNGEKLLEEILLFENDVNIDDVSEFIDINNDGNLDFLISTIDSIVAIVYKNGTYERSHAGQKPSNSYYSELQFFDMDGDNHLELFCSTPSQIMINKNWEVNISDFKEFLGFENLNGETIMNFEFYNNNFKPGLIVESNLNSYFFHGTEGNLKMTNKLNFGFKSFCDIGDINMDGFKDVIVSHEGNIYSLTYEQTNDTLLTQELTADDLYKNCMSGTLLDIDDNGSLDLVYRKFNHLYFRKNDGSGGFLSEVQITPLVPTNNLQDNLKFDFDKDGKTDLLHGGLGTFDLVIIKPGFNFQVQNGWFQVSFRDIKCANLDGDAYNDIIGFNTNGSVEILWGDANVNFEDKVELKIPYGVQYGFIQDINKDGIKDILFITQTWNNQSSMYMIKGIGSRKFEESVEWKAIGGVSKFIPIDSDNNGEEEFLIYNWYGSNICRYFPGDNEFDELYLNPKSNIQTNIKSISDITVIDLNKDQFPDIVIVDSPSKKIGFLINDKSGGFVETNLTTENEPLSIVSYDYDNDGWDDILVVSKLSDSVQEMQVLINDHNEGFYFHTSFILNNLYQPSKIEKIDLDNDNDLDLIVSNWDYSRSVVYEKKANEDSLFRNSAVFFGLNDQCSRAFDDINNDKKIDIINAYFNTGNISIRINNSVAEPGIQEVSILVDTIQHNGATVILNELNTTGSITILKEGTGTSFVPEDGKFYTHNTSFGIGANVSENAYVVYSGADTVIEVTGLKSNTTYEVVAFEYNSNIPENTIVNYGTEAVIAAFTTKKAIFSIQDFPDTIKIEEDSILTLELSEYINDFGENSYSVSNQNPEVHINLQNNSLEIIPFQDYYGSDSISITASLPNEVFIATFYLSILSVDDPITIQQIDNHVVVNAEALGNEQKVSIQYEDPDHTSGLRFEVSSSNQQVVSDSDILVEVKEDELVITYKSSDYGISKITVIIIDEFGAEVRMSFDLEIAKITGFEDIAVMEDLYPNPTTGLVYFKKQIQKNSSAVLFNLMGEIIIQDINLNVGEIDLSNISNGIYILRGQDNAYRIIKE